LKLTELLYVRQIPPVKSVSQFRKIVLINNLYKGPPNINS
jgi:hypothetical protein